MVLALLTGQFQDQACRWYPENLDYIISHAYQPCFLQTSYLSRAFASQKMPGSISPGGSDSFWIARTVQVLPNQAGPIHRPWKRIGCEKEPLSPGSGILNLSICIGQYLRLVEKSDTIAHICENWLNNGSYQDGSHEHRQRSSEAAQYQDNANLEPLVTVSCPSINRKFPGIPST